jgi:DNA-binding NarL/FixJ family response regulator
MSKENAQPGDMSSERSELSEDDKELAVLVALALTDDEIAAQLQIPKLKVRNRIARLLARLGARERLEILLYALSDPAISRQISKKVGEKTTKRPQVQTRGVKPKAS